MDQQPAPDSRDRNVLAAWALAVSDVVRTAAERATGTGGNGPAALVAIVADPGLSIDELRHVLALTHPGTVRLVDRLAARGWVYRAQGTGRTVRLEPTTAGRRVARELANARENALADFLSVLPHDDVHTLARLVDPVLASTVSDLNAVRRMCRLCTRSICDPCPAEGESPSAARPHADRPSTRQRDHSAQE